MIVVSALLDQFFRKRLLNKKTRRHYYEKALRNELRFSKLGLVALRNLNELMAENPAWHDEFAQLLNGKDYQSAFWESDLGYLWYQGNLRAQNSYFALAIDHIQKKKYTSVLDVGCGWGEFVSKAASTRGVGRAVGIDISKDIIQKARELHPKANLEHKNVTDVLEHFDLVTLFGSTDYLHPDEFKQILSKILSIANKEVILVNSLRKIAFSDALKLRESIEVKRYDTGYVHPIPFVLEQLKSDYNFSYTTQKAGTDSILTLIKKG